MQGTIRSWDAATGTGTLLLDDGRQLDFPGEAVQVRSLRLGQRVRLRLEADHVVALTVATLPFR
jgi:2-phospho-L-lactate guanylyltransferase